jgi:hypothetical protein
MTQLDPKLFVKVETLAHTVLKDLRSKGYIVPTKLGKDKFSFDGYVVGRDAEGFYYIVNPNRFTNIRKINLLQTAAVVANNLALGRLTVDKVLEADRNYGYKMFDQAIFDRCMKRSQQDIDKFAFYQTRLQDAKMQAESCKNTITASFEKLRSLR